MVQFVLILLAVAGCLVAFWILYDIGEIWRGRHLPEVLAHAANDFHENQRIRRLIESRLECLETNLTADQRLSGRDRLTLVEYALNQWILFNRRPKHAATTRVTRVHELAIALQQNFQGTFPASAAITTDWQSLAMQLAAALCGDDAAKVGQ